MWSTPALLTTTSSAPKAWTVAGMVLAPPPTTSGPISLSQVTVVDRALDRDATLAGVESSTRDPFHKVRAPRRASTPKPPPRAPSPQLRLILYDQLSPEVQFSVAGEISGRLTPGQSFRGWTVVSISARACVVQKDGESLTLTPRR